MAAHVLLFPFPAQGHINCMLKLAELLSIAGLHVTFLNTDYNHRRLSSFSSAFARLTLCPRFRFLSIPDGLPDDDLRPATGLWDLDDSLRTRSGIHLRELLLSCRQDQWPELTCVLVDSVMPFAIEPVEDLGIPVIIFRTASACSLWAYHCIPKLIQSGELPFPEEADLNEKIQGVPGMESFLRRRDLPSFCREARDPGSRSLQMVSRAVANVNRARAIILNTCESLEGPILAHIRSVCPTIFAIGPLHALLARTTDSINRSQQRANSDKPTVSGSGNLWLEDRTCMTWLDSKPKGSVVYVSFGTFTVMPRNELLEFWHGLVNSGYCFLWVVRPDLVDGVESSEWLTWTQQRDQVAEETRRKGFIVEWAPQEEINSRFVSEVWRIGLDMKDMSGREVVERMVRQVMGGGGKELRQSALAKAELAKRSVQEDGSSYLNFQSLLHYINSLVAVISCENTGSWSYPAWHQLRLHMD
ncbi:hypothetical protein J5N97_006197 [Dioscorea zingiberensis]|uniref:Glycosyltransferase N-terminal domain-containing protein n=1 Tax=Dioscorea zingiberensis TaxID=325984 RepID=A0A9D5HTG0_9LILI|nr:hypothetical protein J5N97_006197 [Dioscorea zingiberensis]